MNDASSSLLFSSSLDDAQLTIGEISLRDDKFDFMGVEWFSVVLLSSDSNVSLTYSSGTSSGIEVSWDREDRVCIRILSSGMEESRDLLSVRLRDTLGISSGTELSVAVCSEGVRVLISSVTAEERSVLRSLDFNDAFLLAETVLTDAGRSGKQKQQQQQQQQPVSLVSFRKPRQCQTIAAEPVVQRFSHESEAFGSSF